MSRIGKKPVSVVDGVKIAIADHHLSFEGPKGRLELDAHPAVDVAYDEASKQILITRRDDQKQSKALHGLTRSLVANCVEGVSKGYRRALEIQGVGYKAEIRGKQLVLNVGFANSVPLEIPGNLKVAVEGNKIIVEGVDKQAVGQFASQVRRVRKPEPYKGKGIRYEGEVVKIKPGKAVTGTGAK
jgi:large subunit ribosomal protein L6